MSFAEFFCEYIVRGSYVSRQYMGQHSRICHDLDLLLLGDFDRTKVISHIASLTERCSGFDNTFEHKMIWENSPSPGLRFLLPYTHPNGSTKLQLDVASGDPVLGVVQVTNEKLRYSTVGVETLAAWKLHGLFEHLHGPWQAKTLWDLYVLCKENVFDATLFVDASKLAFSSRQDPIQIINRLLRGDFGGSSTSKKNWKRDFPTFTKGEFIPLDTVLKFLRTYLRNHFDFGGELLTSKDVIAYRVKLLKELGTEEATEKLKSLHRKKRKILGHKAYYSIAHLPESRLGPTERCITERQSELLCDPAFAEEGRVVIVQEKLDGSCVCAYRKSDTVFALGREGDLAELSPNESRRMWAEWMAQNEERFLSALENGERMCGEWMVMVHGTHYDLPHEPFVAFDVFDISNRVLSYSEFNARADRGGFSTPHLVHQGGPIPLSDALEKLGPGFHGSRETPEGLIFRLERNGKPAFKAKYVRHDKVDGCFLEEATFAETQWNTFATDEY